MLFLLPRALLPFQLYISAKDTASLLLVSTGMIFRSKYLFKNSSKFCYSLHEHFNPHYSDQWKVVNSISEVSTSHVTVSRDKEGFWSLVPHTQLMLFLLYAS